MNFYKEQILSCIYQITQIRKRGEGKSVKCLLIVLMILASLPVVAQKPSFGFQTGIGLYSMTGLENLNIMIQEELPFQTKIISNYPPFFYYKPSISIEHKSFSYGISLGCYSSGSRISAKDYSGEYLFDTKVSSVAPGLIFEFFPISLKNKRLFFYTQPGVLFSKMELEEYPMMDNEEIDNTKMNLNSMNFFFEPGLKLSSKYSKSLKFYAFLGYFLQFGRRVLATDDFQGFTDHHTQQYSEAWQLKETEEYVEGSMIIQQIDMLIEHWYKEKNELKNELLRQYIALFITEYFPFSEFESLFPSDPKSRICYYCKVSDQEIARLRDMRKIYSKRQRGYFMEIDRIEPNKEYFKDNCILACYWCNNAKTDEFSLDEFSEHIGPGIKSIWKERKS